MTGLDGEPPEINATHSIPRHVAIIMDGNGRWAKQHALPRTEGHRKGVETVREVVRAAGEMGIEYLTLFSFSSENWRRPKVEVDALLALLKRFIQRDLAELHGENVRVRVIGGRDDLAPDILGLIEQAEDLTRANRGSNLTIAFNYGGQGEIARAVARIAAAIEAGELAARDITTQLVSRYLDTADLPDPDILIRTSGEQRLSNFLLWQLAYSELIFVDQFWPDFTKESLARAIAEYQRRERRFGGVPVAVARTP